MMDFGKKKAKKGKHEGDCGKAAKKAAPKSKDAAKKGKGKGKPCC